MGREKDLKHGTTNTYRYHKCRCCYCKMAKSISDKKHYYRVKEYAQRKKDRSAEKRRERKESGVCCVCGFEKDEGRENRDRCLSCNESETIRTRERRALHYERGFR